MGRKKRVMKDALHLINSNYDDGGGDASDDDGDDDDIVCANDDGGGDGIALTQHRLFCHLQLVL